MMRTTPLLASPNTMLPAAQSPLLGRIASVEANGKVGQVFPEMVHGERNDRRIIVGFMGRRGKGKTLAQTFLCGFMKAAYQHAGDHRRRILSNYHISFADFSHPKLLDQVRQLPYLATQSLVAIDELTTAIPSSRSMSSNNTEIARVVEQIRKLNSDVIWTTQFPTDLARFILRQTDIYLKAKGFYRYKNNGTVYLEGWDYWGQFITDARNRHWPPDLDPPDFTIALTNVNVILGTYRTEEVIPAMWSEYRDLVLGRFWQLDDMDGSILEGLGPDLDGLPEPKADAALEFRGTSRNQPQRQVADDPLAELVSSQTGSFMVRGVYQRAKEQGVQVHGSISEFAGWLAKHGYKVSGRGAQMTAEAEA